jgi:heparan-alpha-glucosaminide N-acetyltransferase
MASITRQPAQGPFMKGLAFLLWALLLLGVPTSAIQAETNLLEGGFDAVAYPAQIRFGHEATLLSNVSMRVDLMNGSILVNLFPSVAFGDITEYKLIPPGIWILQLSDSTSRQRLGNLGPYTFWKKDSVFAFTDDTGALSGVYVKQNISSPDKSWGPDLSNVRFVNLATRYNCLEIWGVTNDCYKCLKLPFTLVNRTNPVSEVLTLSTAHSTDLEIRANTSYNLASRSHLFGLYPTKFNKNDVLGIIADFNKFKQPSSNGLVHQAVVTAFNYAFGEYGVYTILLKEEKVGNDWVLTHQVLVDIEPDDPYVPIYIAIGCYVGLALIWVIGTYTFYWAKKRWEQRKAETDLGSTLSDNLTYTSVNTVPPRPSGNKPAPAKQRVLSLDAFRGFSIVIMIFVNYGGGGYWFFNHSTWNGLTVADLVFPWFIWIMGTSMAMSFDSLERSRAPTLDVLWKVVRRALILFGLGLFFINGGHDYKTWRIPGVLQRFGVAYLVVGLILMFVPKWKWMWTWRLIGQRGRQGLEGNVASPIIRRKKFTDDDPTEESESDDDHAKDLDLTAELDETHYENLMKEHWLYRWFGDLVPYWMQWVAALALLFLYFMLTFELPVPGCPTGYLGPGGIGDYGQYYDCTGGAAGYIDKEFLGNSHIYQTPTCQPVYLTGAYDPEGTLGNLTSIFLVFLGLQSGRIILVYKTHTQRIIRWVIWGILIGCLSVLLCEGERDGGWIPITKNLWSPSFIFATGGGAFVLLALSYFLIDVVKVWNGSPFRFVGMNPILIYMGHEILGGYMPFSFALYGDVSHAAMLASNLVGMSCWCLIAYYMYYNRFFISI